MKKNLFLQIIILSIVTCGCHNTNKENEPEKEKEGENNSSIKVTIPEYISLNDTALLICREYVNYIGNKDLIYQIYFEQKPDTIVILITYAYCLELLNLDKVIGYFNLDNNIFLLYFGQNYFFNTTDDLRKYLELEIKRRNIPSVFRNSATFDYGYLEVKFSQKSGRYNKKYIGRRRYGFPSPPPPPILPVAPARRSFSKEGNILIPSV